LISFTLPNTPVGDVTPSPRMITESSLSIISV
jgi:hypothetical protein